MLYNRQIEKVKKAPRISMMLSEKITKETKLTWYIPTGASREVFLGCCLLALCRCS